MEYHLIRGEMLREYPICDGETQKFYFGHMKFELPPSRVVIGGRIYEFWRPGDEARNNDVLIKQLLCDKLEIKSHVLHTKKYNNKRHSQSRNL